MKSILKNQLKLLPILIGIFLVSSTGFYKTAHAIGSPLGGSVSVLGPAWQISLDKEICQIDQWTVAEETQTTEWTAMTDQGDDQTFNLMQDFSPQYHPDAYIVSRSVKSDTPSSIQQNVWLKGLFQTEYKEVGSCQYTDTTTYPPVSVSWDLPSYMNLGNVTEYGVSQTEM